MLAAAQQFSYLDYILACVSPRSTLVKLTSFNLNYDYSGELEVVFPPSLTDACLRSLPPTVEKLNLNVLWVSHSLLLTVAQSSAASSLTELLLDNALITDDFAPMWQSFPNLAVLEIESARFLRMESLRALSMLPKLQELYLLVDTSSIFYLDMLDVMLAPGASPLLRSLRVEGVQSVSARAFDISVARLILLLQRRENRERLENLGLGQGFPDSSGSLGSAEATEIRSLCPHLILFCLPIDTSIREGFGKWTPKQPGRQEWSNSSSDSPRRFGLDPLEFSQYYPNLVSLWDLYSICCRNPDFRPLRFLRRLDLRFQHPVEITHLPPFLSYFALDMQFEVGEDERATDTVRSLYCVISSQIPNLKSLVLRIPEALVTCGDLLDLLESLPALDELRLDHFPRFPDEVEKEETLKLNHESIKAWPMIRALGVRVVPGWLPALQVYDSFGAWDKTQKTDPKSFAPSMLCFSVSRSSDRNPGPRPLSELLTPRTREIRANSILIPDLQVICSLRHLLSLSLEVQTDGNLHRGTPSDPTSLQTLFSSLPQLLHFSLNTPYCFNVENVCHQNLSSLTLRFNGTPGSRTTFTLSSGSEQLPNLQSLFLSATRMTLSINNSSSLVDLSVAGCSVPADIRLSNCSCLSRIFADFVILGSLHLVSTPRLASISVVGSDLRRLLQPGAFLYDVNELVEPPAWFSSRAAYWEQFASTFARIRSGSSTVDCFNPWRRMLSP